MSVTTIDIIDVFQRSSSEWLIVQRGSLLEA